MNFITSYSLIRSHCIRKNGAVLFTQPATLTLDQFLTAAYEFVHPGYPKFYKMDHLAKFGFIATELLLQNRRLSEDYPANQIAAVLSNASSSLDTDRRYYTSTKQIASPALFVYTLPNIVLGEICIRHGLKGENGFFIFGQFNPQFMAGYVDQVLQRGAQSCLAGWLETNEEEYDVFLYLTEKEKKGEGLDHTSETISKLYNQ